MLIVQTGLLDLDLLHSPYSDIWWKEIPQSFDSQMVSSFSLRDSTHHSLYRASAQVHPYPAMCQQDPHKDPPGLGKTLKSLKLALNRKTDI